MIYQGSPALEEKVRSLFQPDPALADEYVETLRRKSHLEPRKKAYAGGAEDAIMRFKKYAMAGDVKGKRLFREAEEWLLEERSDWPFSLESICFYLGMSAGYIRRGLIGWKERTLIQAGIIKRPKGKKLKLAA